jgi:signal transduction histidine kinase
VKDDGQGLVATGAGRPDSYGILGMRERAAVIGALLEIESAPGTGTTVRCRVKEVKTL